ncbi:probable RNA-directed DNA polymerase from transposon BS isoform X4 [Hypanus sabinus]|uniref:probable RNA-directed DNA polymerase from transposon BS isoform X4 n=1 Tax=Hypanus sabinus TaxID=79690 RepID=UPI0028C3A860|nr:probable RNA-directed DNA polymerase from transposon BS isoform X4 [Hypanus sabinus]XP_059823894.1 probable RNA-directed DNA polymerase from transposon BS isoform X4 [Hypanus sabinus]XP_059823895.1 probable RNA-directed DNA polymerase from transposon BS isoform X4 [Hypanus sabinus]
MKCFERLVMAHINHNLPVKLYALQFAYRSNKSMADAISLALHSSLEHLENKDAYVRLLFIDYSSALNTIIPNNLIPKLRNLGLSTQICSWIFNFLTDRTQAVKIGDQLSSTITLSTGAPQGCVLSPLLYSLYTHDCVAKLPSNSIYKFADDTIIVGRILGNDESEYKEEIKNLVAWCEDNNLSLNVSKTKELVVDFRRSSGPHDPIYISGAQLEQVKSFKFLGVNITNELTWSNQAESTAKKAHQCLYFLRKLKKFGLSPKTLTNFYRCTVESTFLGCITTWYGSCPVQDRKKLQKIVNLAQHITQTNLPSLDSLYTTRCRSSAARIIKNKTHPAKTLFDPLPSERRFRSLKIRTARFGNSFFPTVIRLLNGS